MFYHVMKVKWFFEFIQCILNRDGIRSIERALTKFTVLLFLLTAVIKKPEWVLNRLVCKRGCWTWNKMIPNPKHLQAVIHCLVLYQLCTTDTAVDKLFLSYSRYSSYSHISMSVDVFSTKVGYEGTIFTSSTGDGAAILRGHPRHAKV